ncbi:type II secretion system F family protein [Nocardioides limicola]|uniref:type II secretion system F family protein n=1 Tax=Nocardioides limicola TaxID=2803368 RepID=UPI00193B02A5|nr:type II secretion system F family protein [Nocardioides sp. DJM-14]
MSWATLTGLAVGAGFAAAVVLLVAVVRGAEPDRVILTRAKTWWSSAAARRATYAATAAVVVGVLSRWPVAAAAAAAVVWVGPAVFGGGRDGVRQIERLEALVTWMESLRDTVATASSLEQAIPRSLDGASELIGEPLRRLVALMQARVPLPQALAHFGEDLDDATADQVVAALYLSARLHGPGLVATMSNLIETTREELEMRRRIEAARRSLRRNTRIIVGVSVGMVGAISLFSREFVAPYSTMQGQMVLVLLIGGFALGLWIIRRAGAIDAPERFLASPEQMASLGGAR